MTVRTAAPLPECALCETPTERAAWEGNGGLCTPCTRGVADTIRMLPVSRGGLIDLDNARRRRALLTGAGPVMDDPTVFTELFVPPVPDPPLPAVEFGVVFTDEEPQQQR